MTPPLPHSRAPRPGLGGTPKGCARLPQTALTCAAARPCAKRALIRPHSEPLSVFFELVCGGCARTDGGRARSCNVVAAQPRPGDSRHCCGGAGARRLSDRPLIKCRWTSSSSATMHHHRSATALPRSHRECSTHTTAAWFSHIQADAVVLRGPEFMTCACTSGSLSHAGPPARRRVGLAGLAALLGHSSAYRACRR